MSSLSKNLRTFFKADGRTTILPIDHGTAIPVPELRDPRRLIASVRDFCDGFVVNYGLARVAEGELLGRGVCLRTDVYKPAAPGNRDHGSYQVYGAEEAMRVGARAVMNMLYTHHPEEDRLFCECACLISECHRHGLPVILEALPYGIGRPAEYTVENVRLAVRAAGELGADVVKTAYPGDQHGFAAIVAESLVPVIVLGGAASADEVAVLGSVREALDAGAAGVAIGRNVWQHARPAAMARALHLLVHEDAALSQALEALRDGS